jgi:hypothetical protein
MKHAPLAYVAVMVDFHSGFQHCVIADYNVIADVNLREDLYAFT